MEPSMILELQFHFHTNNRIPRNCSFVQKIFCAHFLANITIIRLEFLPSLSLCVYGASSRDIVS